MILSIIELLISLRCLSVTFKGVLCYFILTPSAVTTTFPERALFKFRLYRVAYL